ncbi:MAG: hypothetical protein JO322_06325 [Candidatus Eremiobacteraeota bacterium]|nr:hypothetical protein [Candidatus Eremiobacteraeota bacterium]
MEILGTNFAITLGSWRLCFRLAVEDIDAPAPAKPEVPHRIRIVEEIPHARRRRASAN